MNRFTYSSFQVFGLCTLVASLHLHAEEAGPIADNSFLIEEAYNQEEGVVQYIQAYQYSRHAKEWIYTFTQEVAAPNQTHQLSYVIPVASVGDPIGPRNRRADCDDRHIGIVRAVRRFIIGQLLNR